MPDQPRVTRIVPSEAKPGDKLQIIGEGFQRDDQVEIWDDSQGALEKRLSASATRWISAEELQITLPKRITGGQKHIAILRQDGTLYHTEGFFTLQPLVSELVATGGTEVTIRGYGFTPYSRVLIGDRELIPTSVTSSRLTVTLPQDIPLPEPLAPSVTTMDVRAAPSAAPMTLSSDFVVRRDGFSFGNDIAYQMASWGTFVETFGEEQVKKANRLPTFLFFWAYYALYTSFFEGTGIFKASGLCSGLAALCLERFCQRALPPNYELEPTPEIRKKLTVQMGKILGREVLTSAYEQCTQGLANVAHAINQIQASLQNGITAGNAQMLWFLPSGKITQKSFVEQLGNAHSVVPYALTFTPEMDRLRWRISIYDVNMPGREDVWVDIEQRDGTWSWQHNLDGRFSSGRGMTLAALPLSLFLKPATFPFSGPFGLTGFLFDLLF